MKCNPVAVSENCIQYYYIIIAQVYAIGRQEELSTRKVIFTEAAR